MSSITPAGQIAPESTELEELAQLAPAVDEVAFDASEELDGDDFDGLGDEIELEDDSDEAEASDDSDDSDDSEDDDEIDGESDDFEDADDSDDAEGIDGEPAVPFSTLGLPEALTALLAREGVVNAFPIQAATIPDALAGRHVLGKARTGSGKTLAFGLPMIANLQGKRARKGKPLGLVLVPTRELAMQVSEALRPYGYAIGVDIAAVYGGAPMYKQVFALRRGVEVLVATPGRLTDLIEQEECSLEEVSIAILDEADQMADMGFMPVVSELLSQTDPAGQRLLFSATLDGAVDELVQKYLTDPVLHSVASEDTTPARMDHHLLVVEPTDKSTITAEIAARHTPGSEDSRRTILFARTKLGADRIAEKIREAGVSALALHGGMTQRARTRTLDDFKAGRVPVLVATDVAARGIHVDGIDLVLHVDPANDAKDYLHRAGRTARAGEAGTVVTLVLPKQRKATLRLLEQAGVEAEMTKVAPSSDALRRVTGGRPVAEYTAEVEAWRVARTAAREARFGDRGDRGERGDRFERGGDRHDRGGRFERPVRFEDRGERSDRGTRFERDRARDQRFGDSRGGFGGDRSGRGERPAFGGDRERSSFGGDRERSNFGGDRGGFGGDRSGRSERPSFGDRDRGGFGGDRGGRSERPSFGDRERPNFADRGERGERGERGGFGGDRSGRSERPSFGDRDRGGFGGDRGGRSERPSFGDRNDRGSSGGDRSGRGERPAFGGDRSGRGERPAFGGDRSGRGERPAFGGDRSGRSERPAFGDRERGGFGGDRGDRVPRQGGFGDRGPRSNDRSGSGFGGPPRGTRDDRGFRGAGDGARNDRGGSRDFGGDRNRGSFGDRDSRGGGSFGNRDPRGGSSFGNRDSRGGSSFGNRTDRRPGENAGDRGPWREQRDRRDFGDRPAGNRTDGDQRGGAGGGDRNTFSRNGGERRGFGGGERREERPGRDRRW